MFERERHRAIALVLQALDAEALAGNGCLFGGGTAMALRYGEYRESVDIDFVVSELAGFRALRRQLTRPEGLLAITRPGTTLDQTRAVRADQYGVRTMLSVGGFSIKLEIVLEARIELQAPGADDRVCTVATLTPLDMATTKLLANSDRWADDSVHSRDLIDLAMMPPDKKRLRQAIDKASGAYGPSIDADLRKAVDNLRSRPDRLERCMQAMAITGVPKAVLWQRIRALAPRRARQADSPPPVAG